MTRYYKFADIRFAIEGLPDTVSEGEFLHLFRTDMDKPDLMVKVHLQELELSEKAVRSGDRYFLVENGKQYLYSWFRTPRPAILNAPADWKSDYVLVCMNHELCEDRLFTVNQLLALSSFTSALVFRGCAVFHCSYVLTGNKALLFAGASGAGKSTQAALWERLRGARIINGDRAILFRRSDGWYAGGISVCGSSRICENRTAKIAAVVALEKGTDNRLLPMSVSEKYRTILAGMAFQRQSPEESERADRMAMEIISELPIFRFRNRADAESVDVFEHEIGGVLYDL